MARYAVITRPSPTPPARLHLAYDALELRPSGERGKKRKVTHATAAVMTKFSFTRTVAPRNTPPRIDHGAANRVRTRKHATASAKYASRSDSVSLRVVS